ncbi:MAG: hypothetical protein K9K34_19315 [Desulfarculaceae bacterium]|nr:hypothetical protein [Desulfarculaceae bacterium]
MENDENKQVLKLLQEGHSLEDSLGLMDEEDKTQGVNPRIKRYVDYIESMDSRDPLNEGLSQPFVRLNQIIRDKVPLLSKDKSFFDPWFRRLSKKQLTLGQFISYILTNLGEKNLARATGYDESTAYMRRNVEKNLLDVLMKMKKLP